MKKISESITASVDHFAPEMPRTGRNKSDDQITNKIKNATKSDDLFQRLIRNPTELNCKTYRKSRNKVTEIRSEKKNANFKKLGTNPAAKTIYKTSRWYEFTGLQCFKQPFHIYWTETVIQIIRSNRRSRKKVYTQ